MEMERFLRQQNMKHLREVLARTTDEATVRRVVKLIEREEDDTKKAGDNLIRDDTPSRYKIGEPGQLHEHR